LLLFVPGRDELLKKDSRLYVASLWAAGITQGLMLNATNASGTLPRYEFVETLERIKPLMLARTFGGAKAEAAMSQIWRTTDVNGDGSMSRSELETASKRRFDASDSNRDGALDKTEVAAMRQRQRVATGN
jgi:hypothetical protein